MISTQPEGRGESAGGGGGPGGGGSAAAAGSDVAALVAYIGGAEATGAPSAATVGCW
jgi:hypothetical protein